VPCSVLDFALSFTFLPSPIHSCDKWRQRAFSVSTIGFRANQLPPERCEKEMRSPGSQNDDAASPSVRLKAQNLGKFIRRWRSVRYQRRKRLQTFPKSLRCCAKICSGKTKESRSPITGRLREGVGLIRARSMLPLFFLLFNNCV